jgi:putative DNA primase/helicase
MLDEIPSWVFTLNAGRTVPVGEYMAEGNRNTDLVSLAGFLLRSRGLTGDALEAHLLLMNAGRLPDSEVASIARSVSNYDKFGAADMRDLPLSKLIAEQICSKARYTTSGKWMIYDGKRWRPDPRGVQAKEVHCRWMRTIHDAIIEAGDADRARQAHNLLSQKRIKDVFALLNADPAVLTDPEEFDANQDLLNFQNGTLDLSSMSFRPHSPTDMITMVASRDYDPDATCPTFDQFLGQVLPKDHGDFVLRLMGYSLTGKANEHVFAMFLGAGRNGKTTLANVLPMILGDYCANADPSTFTRKSHDRVTIDIARLKNKRVVTTAEISKGEILDAALMKRLAGGDRITTRHHYEEFFEMSVKALIMMTTNVLPVIDGGDSALARRIIVVPFNRVFDISEVDAGLPDRLAQEASGILNRLLDGLKEYREQGLNVPEDIQAAAARYVDDSDLVAQFLEGFTQADPKASCSVRELYGAYSNEMQSMGLKPMSGPIFKKTLENKGFSTRRTNQKIVWLGLRLLMPGFFG